MTKPAWMPGRLAAVLLVALASQAAVSARADSPSVTKTDPASAINQSLSLDDPDRVPSAAGDGACENGSNSGASNSSGPLPSPDHAGSMLLPQRGPSLPEGRQETTSGGTLGLNFKSLGSLVIVLALMAGVVYILRRIVPTFRAGGHDALRVVARAGLSSKHSLALVRLGRRYLLVGVGGDGLNCLCEIEDAEEIAELTAHFGEPRRAQHGFDKLLAQELGDHRVSQSGARAKAGAVDAADGTQGLVGLRSRLRALKAG